MAVSGLPGDGSGVRQESAGAWEAHARSVAARPAGVIMGDDDMASQSELSESVADGEADGEAAVEQLAAGTLAAESGEVVVEPVEPVEAPPEGSDAVVEPPPPPLARFARVRDPRSFFYTAADGGSASFRFTLLRPSAIRPFGGWQCTCWHPKTTTAACVAQLVGLAD